jgi:hypothetical protein
LDSKSLRGSLASLFLYFELARKFAKNNIMKNSIQKYFVTIRALQVILLVAVASAVTLDKI